MKALGMTRPADPATTAPFEIVLDNLIGSNACIIANPGGGKSGAIRRMLEVTHGAIQHIVLDPEDEFHTLRSALDYVIVGGGGDLPISVKAAEGLALAALTHGFSMIVQMNDLGDDMGLFVAHFLNALVGAPAALWRPLLITIDEAHHFIPKGSASDTAKAVVNLMRKGRKRGFVTVLASQRITDIDASARGLATQWMLGMTGQTLDRNTAAEQLGFTKREALEKLRGMEPRDFWCVGTALAREATLVRIADTETPIVKHGHIMATPPAPEALREILAGLVQATAAPTAPDKTAAAPGDAPQSDVEAIRAEAHATGYAEGRENGMKGAISGVLGLLRPLIRDLEVQAYGEDSERVGETERAMLTGSPLREDAVVEIKDGDLATGLGPGVVVLKRVDETTFGVTGRKINSSPFPMPAVLGTTKSTPQQRILDVIMEWQSIKPGPVSRSMVAWLADVSPKSSGYANNLGALRSAGMLTYPESGMLDLTAEGRAIAQTPKRKLTNDAIQRALLDKLARPQQVLVEALLEDWPQGTTRDRLAQRCGVSANSSGYANNLGALRSMGALDYPRPGEVKLTDMLFPFGAGH